MLNDRRFTVGGVALVEGRLGRLGPIMTQVYREVDPLLKEDGWPGNAPFAYVNLIIEFGLKNEETPRYGQIIKKYRELPLNIEVDAHPLLSTDTTVKENVFRMAIARALLDVAAKYGLETQSLQRYYDELPL